jgi:hypothetical protein
MSVGESRRVNWFRYKEDNDGSAAFPAPLSRITMPIATATWTGPNSPRCPYDTQSQRYLPATSQCL